MGYSVDLALLERVVGELDRAQKHLDQQLGDLDRVVESLRSIWKGDAAVAQQEAYTTWTAEARDMHRALTILHGAARTAHGNYSAAVSSNVRMWEQVQ